MTNPRKPRKKTKSSKITINSKKDWERILKDIDKKEMPIEVLETIVVRLVDGTNVEINIRELLSEGQSPEDLEKTLNSRIQSLESIIANIDFYIDVEKVAKTVQVQTNELLKNL